MCGELSCCINTHRYSECWKISRYEESRSGAYKLCGLSPQATKINTSSFARGMVSVFVYVTVYRLVGKRSSITRIDMYQI
jgi:hypothetical protein